MTKYKFIYSFHWDIIGKYRPIECQYPLCWAARGPPVVRWLGDRVCWEVSP